MSQPKPRSEIKNRFLSVIPEWGIGVLVIGLVGQSVPRPVSATRFLKDGEICENEFRVIHTPGHTLGHTSYYHEPTKTLFAGDAIAVVRNEIRFMARPVTLNHADARKSMQKCLNFPIEVLCPGHREPLTNKVKNECDKMRATLATNSPWPLLG